MDRNVERNYRPRPTPARCPTMPNVITLLGRLTAIATDPHGFGTLWSVRVEGPAGSVLPSSPLFGRVVQILAPTKYDAVLRRHSLKIDDHLQFAASYVGDEHGGRFVLLHPNELTKISLPPSTPDR